jgi:hypothetical protein
MSRIERSGLVWRLILLSSLLCCRPAQPAVVGASPYSKWTRGPSTSPAFFPLAVWLQSPANAQRYRDAGFNTYIGLWRGPTDAQLEALRQTGLNLICEQNAAALRHLEDAVIIGWMHGDEPDNAQSLADKSGWGPPIPPQKIVESFHRLQAADPSRPVMLNLGQGVAWDQWYGRGVRANHPEDYPKYLEGCDIASFDIYPVVHENKEIAGKLWYVPKGVERIVQWVGDRKPVWNCIECTHISNPDRKPTPHEIRSEAWMSLIHGSRGLIFFVNEFKPKFREAALLDDTETLAAVTMLNRQITQLAPVLNAPAIHDGVTLRAENPSESVAVMLKRHEGATYLFAVEMLGNTALEEISLKGMEGEQTVEVLGENRSIPTASGRFKDRFAPWEVHLYRLRN